MTNPDTGFLTEFYLGDGLYVKFDGYTLVLRAPRKEGDHFVALESQVYRALMTWIKQYPMLRDYLEGNSS